MSLTISLTACANPQKLVEDAAREKAKAEASVKIVTIAKKLPAQPSDCRKLEASGVTIGERLDVALVRTDQARRRANARVLRCADWYANLKKGFAK